MPVTNYHTVDGRMVGETTNEVRTDYFPDALGSVVMTASGGAQQNRYQHAPYGGTSKISGTEPDPRFLWVGTYGYRTTQMAWSDYYVRARHYDSFSANWTTKDPWTDRGVFDRRAPWEECYVLPTIPGPLFILPKNPMATRVFDFFNKQAYLCGYSAKEAATLAALMECIAQGEDPSWNPGARGGTNNKAVGLFQLDKGQYEAYLRNCGYRYVFGCRLEEPFGAPNPKSDKPLEDPDTNMRVMWFLLFYSLCKRLATFGALSERTIFDLLGTSWGVLPGYRGKPRRLILQESNGAMDCLARKGLVRRKAKKCKTPSMMPMVGKTRLKSQWEYELLQTVPYPYVPLNSLFCKACDPCL